MLQDRILIFDDEGNAFDAPGNIGTGKRSFAELTLDAPLSKFGINGLAAQVHRAAPAHPGRRPDRRRPAQLQRLLPDWEWRRRRAPRRRRHSPTASPSTTATASPSIAPTSSTRTSTAALTARRSSNIGRPHERRSRFDVDNLFDTTGNPRTGGCSIPTAPTPDRSIDEFRERNRHRSFGLTLKQSFGGGEQQRGGEGGLT